MNANKLLLTPLLLWGCVQTSRASEEARPEVSETAPRTGSLVAFQVKGMKKTKSGAT